MTGGMRIVAWDPADSSALRGCQAAWGAAMDIDDPRGPRMTGQVLSAWLRRGFTGDPAKAWLIRGPRRGASPAGTASSCLTWRTSTGRTCWSWSIPRRAAGGSPGNCCGTPRSGPQTAGRSTLGGEVRDGSAGDVFAAAAGAKPGMAAALRRLDLRTVPAGKFARLRAAATDAAAGYSLVRWTGPTPPEHRGAAGRRCSTRTTTRRTRRATRWRPGTPTRSGSVPRLCRLAMGVRRYASRRLHDASGEMAGITRCPSIRRARSGGTRG